MARPGLVESMFCQKIGQRHAGEMQPDCKSLVASRPLSHNNRRVTEYLSQLEGKILRTTISPPGQALAFLSSQFVHLVCGQPLRWAVSYQVVGRWDFHVAVGHLQPSVRCSQSTPKYPQFKSLIGPTTLH